MDERLISDRFPRASGYHPEWVLAGVSGAANPLWMTEWLAEALDLRSGMRVLDLGCGRALSSVFLRREFGVQVWATDLWFSASENLQRIRDAGVEDGVFPIHADARSLPFADGFFDAVVSIDSFVYYGTDDLYLNYLARFVKPGGPIGIAGAGLMREMEGPIPEHLREWWTADLWCLHSSDMVAAALGADRHPGHRGGRHAARRLAALARLAQARRPRQCDGDPGVGSRRRPPSRLRPSRGSAPGRCAVDGSDCVRAHAVQDTRRCSVARGRSDPRPLGRPVPSRCCRRDSARGSLLVASRVRPPRRGLTIGRTRVPPTREDCRASG